MQIFKVRSLETAPLLQVNLNDEISVFEDSVIGKAKRYELPWKPIPTTRFKKPGDRKVRKYCDLTYILANVNVPIFSGSAKTSLEPILGDTVQWLPIEFQEQEYWIVNILKTVSLDLQSSQIISYPDGGLATIEQFAFEELSVRDKWLFKVPQRTFWVLCTERFRDHVLQNELTGFYFEVVWDSRYKPFPDALYNDTDVVGRPEIYGPNGVRPIPKQWRKQYWPPEWFEIEAAKD